MVTTYQYLDGTERPVTVTRNGEVTHDAHGNVVAVRSPRYFDSADTLGYQQASEAFSYTRRNLKATHTVAAGAQAYANPDDAGWSAAKVRVTESWAYNLDRTLDTHTDFRGNGWQSLWSSCCAGRLVAQNDPLGAATTTAHDAQGNTTLSQKVHGLTIFNQQTTRFDARNRPIARTVWLVEQTGIDPQNPPIAGGGLAGDPAAHDGQGNTVGLTTRYLYDEDLTDGTGLDGSGTTVQKLDGSGSYTVDIDSLLTELEADLGAGFFGNGATGSATVTINPEDELSVTISDGAGRTVASGIIAQNGTPITWQTVSHDTLVAIAGVGQVVETTQIDALNHAQKTRTDGAGRTLETVDALGNVTTATFDAAGNQLSSRDPNSIGWNATYDARNRQITMADTQEQAEGKNRQTAYDAHGNVVGTTDAKGQSASSAFDARDRRVSETDRLAGVTSWRFDENSNLRHLTDAENQSPYKPTAWTYDARNLKLTEALPGHNPASQIGDADYDLKQFTYDLAGRVEVATDQKGNTVTHLYDMASRLLQRDYRLYGQTAISDSDVFSYGDAGRMATAQSGRYNNTVAFDYDVAGRLTSESLTVTFGQTTTYTVQSQYDAANRRTGITYPDGSIVARQYTARDQLAQIDYNSAMVATFAYDPASRRTSRTLGDTPGTQTAWVYGRQDNFPSAINSGIPGASFSYTYDANKNKLTEGISAPTANYGFNSTTYDSADRLTAWNRTDGNLDQAWGLSLVGNWATFTENQLQQTRTHTAVHEIATIDSNPIAHDATGNLTRDAGDTLDRYTWDFDNRLLAADVDQDGTAECGYQYDALGRRVSKTVPEGEGSATTVFVGTIQALEHSPHAMQVVAEYAADAAPGSPACKFVYAEYIDEPVLMVRLDGPAETHYYYHQNSLYSVAALTDATGAVVERYAYSAYGEPIFLDASANLLDPQASTVGNPYLFTGRRLDEETGLYYYRARMYDAELGRFVGRDPIGYRGGINWYEYVGGTPLHYCDALGFHGPNPGFGGIPDEMLPNLWPKDWGFTGFAHRLYYGPTSHVTKSFPTVTSLTCRCGDAISIAATAQVNLAAEFGVLGNVVGEGLEGSAGVVAGGEFSITVTLACNLAGHGDREITKRGLVTISFQWAPLHHEIAVRHRLFGWRVLWHSVTPSVWNVDVNAQEKIVSDNGGTCCDESGEL